MKWLALAAFLLFVLCACGRATPDDKMELRVNTKICVQEGDNFCCNSDECWDNERVTHYEETY